VLSIGIQWQPELVIPTLNGGVSHLVHVVALVALASALITLALSMVLASSPFLCWHHSPHCAGVAALVMLALYPCCSGIAIVCGAVYHVVRVHIDYTIQAQQGQRGLHDKGANASAPRATMPAWQGQWHQRNGANTPAWWGQQRRSNDGDNAHALWGQRGQHNSDNNAGTTRATTPMQRWWWCQCNKGNNAIVTMAKTNNAIVTKATTPAWWWQQLHYGKGNNVIVTMAEMPGLQRCLRINDGNTIATRATMPAQW
jgi:hypothetical protein